MLSRKPFLRVPGPGLAKTVEKKIIDVNFDSAKFDQMLQGRNFEAPMLGVRTIYETKPWRQTVDIVNTNKQDKLTYQKAIEMLETKSVESQKAVTGPLKNTVIVDHEGFQPRDHLQLKGLINRDNLKRRKISKKYPRKKLFQKKFNLSLPMIKETLSKIKVPIFKKLFRQVRHNEEPHPDSEPVGQLQDLGEGRKLEEVTRVRGSNQPVVGKHRVSLSEFGEIKSKVHSDSDDDNTNDDDIDHVEETVEPHLIYLQDFN